MDTARLARWETQTYADWVNDKGRHDSAGDNPTVIDKCGQATKGVGWMPWHREAMKDVVACDKLREAGKQASIRRFPNEETQPG